MSEYQFYAYPDKDDFAIAVTKRSVAYDRIGGIVTSSIFEAYFSQAYGYLRQERAGTAYIAKHIEPLDFDDVPYDPAWEQAASYMKGMEVGYRIMDIVQPVVHSEDVIHTLVHGVTASEGEQRDGLLTRPILMDMGLRGLFLVGAEARDGIDILSKQMTSHVEKGLMFKLGIGTVLHIADAVHIQHNMQQHDQYVASAEWVNDLQELSQLNTGE